MSKRSSNKDTHLPLGITRRDFLNAVLIGSGTMLLNMQAPFRVLAAMIPTLGYGGIGDYASSHGNTEEVIRIFQEITSGKYDAPLEGVKGTGESYDLVVIGGGLSGLSAALEYKKSGGRKGLVLENHPIFGGQCKRNEFLVDGYRLMGPQASNAFGVLDLPGMPGYELYSELGVPTEFKYRKLDRGLKPLVFDKTNYGYKIWFTSPNIGYFYDGQEQQWVTEPWKNDFKGAPYPEKVKKDFIKWRASTERHYSGSDYEQWLDSMTLKDYIEKVLGLSSEVTSFADPVLASTVGLGCDVLSAYAGYQVALPGFPDFRGHRSLKNSHWDSFPGGNDGFARYFMKALIPGAIEGKKKFEDILNGAVRFGALDREGNKVRIRNGASVVRVEHVNGAKGSKYVLVTYLKDGQLLSVKARGVVMAGGSFTARHIVRDLPEEYRNAYESFYFAPMLVVNVALKNWRFLYELGLTACRWFEGFGFGCNIRRPMIVGDFRPPLHPDKPAVLTFYVPFQKPGLPIKQQGDEGRNLLLSTSYADYERQIVGQMSRLFGASGFNPEKDIAGIVLNRWMYGYVSPQPGFYFGRDGAPAPRDIIRKPFGRIAFAHAELNGHQHWVAAAMEGLRAARQVMDPL
jgi:spermidine dehydrogenase